MTIRQLHISHPSDCSDMPWSPQVWYPDSAAKTADAIEEFAGEGLPLLVLANWRGFSGGQRDLLEGVLQSGSRIVNALRAFPHPVTVYVPPGCELRGGAWVVVDSQINSSKMEMFAGAILQGVMDLPSAKAMPFPCMILHGVCSAGLCACGMRS
jgi:acetyl-CoA carboxylase carboxyltransferase component